MALPVRQPAAQHLAPFSHLPGRPYPKGTPTFPSRDQVIEHIERQAGEGRIELRLGTRVSGSTATTQAGSSAPARASCTPLR